MPLVRISLPKHLPTDWGKAVGEIVYRAMVDVLSVPQHDHFQVITRHDRDGLIYDPEYLDIKRSDGFLAIQITLNEGRSVELKKAFYRQLADHLHAELAIRTEDVFVNLVEVKKENWSFGNGIAQYAP